MEFNKFRQRKSVNQIVITQDMNVMPSPKNTDNSFSFNEGTDNVKPNKTVKIGKVFPQTTRSRGHELVANPAEFINFVKRLGMNEQGVKTSQALNSDFKGFRAQTIRSNTQQGESRSASHLPKLEVDMTGGQSHYDPAVAQSQSKVTQINGYHGNIRCFQDQIPDKSPSQKGSVTSVAAFQSDIKYLQKLVTLKDEEIHILKHQKDIMAKRFIKQAQAMQIEVQELRHRVNRHEFQEGQFDVKAQLTKIKTRLNNSKSKRGSQADLQKQPSIREHSLVDSLSQNQFDNPGTSSYQRLRTDSVQRLSAVESEVTIPGLTGDEDKQILWAKIKEYDRANRQLTKAVAYLNDKVTSMKNEKTKYETIIFELQNENQLFKKQTSEQTQLLERYEDRRINLSKTLCRLRKFG